MILGVILGIGAIGLAIAEAMRLAAGDIGILDGVVETLSWSVLAAGIWGAKDIVGMARPGRVGIVLISFAAMSFAMVMIITLTAGTLGALAAGEITYGDIVFTPFYLLALVFLLGGLGGFALHFWAIGGPSRLLGSACGALAIIHGARLFVPGALGYHGLANILLGLTLLATGAMIVTKAYEAKAR